MEQTKLTKTLNEAIIPVTFLGKKRPNNPEIVKPNSGENNAIAI